MGVLPVDRGEGQSGPRVHPRKRNTHPNISRLSPRSHAYPHLYLKWGRGKDGRAGETYDDEVRNKEVDDKEICRNSNCQMTEMMVQRENEKSEHCEKARSNAPKSLVLPGGGFECSENPVVFNDVLT